MGSFWGQAHIFIYLLWLRCALSQFCIAPGEYCLNGGTCVSAETDFCACEFGWAGVFCECNCFGNGVCVSADTPDDPIKGRKKCACHAGHVGPTCSFICSSSVNCSGNGHCNDQGKCDCDEQWGGDKCNLSRVCAQCESGGFGECVNDTCVCSDDRKGPTCSCSDSRDCSGHGSCNASSVTVDCECQPGYSGLACEVSPTPAPSLCSQSMECVTCQILRDCMWTESRCELRMQGSTQVPDIDECAAEAAPKSVWIPIVISLGGLVLLVAVFYVVRRVRRYSEVKQKTLNSNVQDNHFRGAPTTPWFSDLAATTEEYVYLDPPDDDED